MEMRSAGRLLQGVTMREEKKIFDLLVLYAL